MHALYFAKVIIRRIRIKEWLPPAHLCHLGFDVINTAAPLSGTAGVVIGRESVLP